MRHVGTLFSVLALGGLGVIAGSGVACSSKDTGFAPKTSPEAGTFVQPTFGEADGGACDDTEDLECKRSKTRALEVQCRAEGKCDGESCTTISGTVYDPAGKVPLYNAMVYIPSRPLEPVPEGVSCDRCGAKAVQPIASAITDVEGHFVLKDVPAGKDIPVVVQVGKWRKRVVISDVKACQENELKTKQTRLPRSMDDDGYDISMPKILLATGSCDKLEDLVRKIGVDEEEFTQVGGNGHVHLASNSSFGSSGGGPTAKSVWSDLDALKQYDMVLLACECGEPYQENEQPVEALKALHTYSDMGGKVFATHYHRYWFKHGPEAVQNVASWRRGNDDTDSSGLYDIDTSFPKGKALADWLEKLSTTSSNGKIQLNDVKKDVDDVSPDATRWIYSASSGSPKYLSYNTPLVDEGGNPVKPEDRCGRVVFSDIHVASGGGFGQPTTGRQSDQELALEFLLFDLSSCVQDDKQPPTPVR